MGGLLEGLGGNRRVQEILICWTVPLLIGSVAFVVVVLPDVRHAAVVASIAAAVRTLHVNKFLFVFVVSLVVAVFLQVNRVPVWRVLEGYAWPKPLRKWRILRAHLPQCRWLQASLFHERAQVHAEQARDRLDQARQAGTADTGQLQQAVAGAETVEAQWLARLADTDQARQNRDRERKYPKGLGFVPRRRQPVLTYGRPAGTKAGRWALPYAAPADKLQPYPRSAGYPADPADTQIMPTRLGNAMRVMETYGANSCGLDSQIMWFELLAEAPASVQATLEEAQFEADTLVCAILTAAALACAAAAGGAWQAVLGTADTKLWVTTAVSVAVALILYRRLLNCVDGWASAIRALVNGSRAPLREKHGLRAPSSPEEEKLMWEALTASIWYGSNPEQERQLARYKLPATDAAPTPEPPQPPRPGFREPEAPTAADRFRSLHQALYWMEARMAGPPDDEPGH
jgi:hypothetical protein